MSHSRQLLRYRPIYTCTSMTRSVDFPLLWLFVGLPWKPYKVVQVQFIHQHTRHTCRTINLSGFQITSARNIRNPRLFRPVRFLCAFHSRIELSVPCPCQYPNSTMETSTSLSANAANLFLKWKWWRISSWRVNNGSSFWRDFRSLFSLISILLLYCHFAFLRWKAF